MPSLGRLIARDRYRNLLVVWWVLGVGLLAAQAWAALRPAPPAEALRLAETIQALGGQPAPRSELPPGTQAALAIVSLLGVAALPLRLASQRSFFRRAVEVTATVAEVMVPPVPVLGLRTVKWTSVRYAFRLEGQPHTGEHLGPPELWSKYAARHGAEVAVLVDPRNPRRSVLKDEWL